MKVWLTTKDGERHECELPFVHADHVTATGWSCECGSTKVAGAGKSIESHDTYRAQAYCAHVDCKRPAGVLRVRLPTLFGLEEDEAVLTGRPRVY